MDLKLISEVATIIGSISISISISIFLTLFFIIIELKKNVDQTKSVNMANRDDTATNLFFFLEPRRECRISFEGTEEL